MRTRSSTLWIVALTGPSSTISVADVGDEPAVRRAAGAGQLGHAPGHVVHRRADDVDQRAARREIRLARARPVERRSRARAGRGSATGAPCSDACVLAVEWRKLNMSSSVPGNHVGRAGAGVDVRALPRRRRKVGVAVVPLRRRELGERRRGAMDRVVGEMRIGDVTLHALDGQRPGQRAAAAVLDHVPQHVDRRRLADDAVVDALSGRGELLDDARRAVDRRTFLVGGEQQRDRSGGVGVAATKASIATTNAASDAFMSAAPRP